MKAKTSKPKTSKKSKGGTAGEDLRRKWDEAHRENDRKKMEADAKVRQQGSTQLVKVETQPAVVVEEIKKLWADMIQHTAKALEVARKIGARLKKVRKGIKKQKGVTFADWVEKNLPFTVRHARNLINIHDQWKAIAVERKKTPGLSIRSALMLMTRSKVRADGRDPDNPGHGSGHKTGAAAAVGVAADANTVSIQMTRKQAGELAQDFDLNPQRAIEFLKAVAGFAVVITD